jgi:HEPN domain-containing protein
MRKIAAGRLKDAVVLLKAKRYDSAVYLVGYAVELALKARICRTLRWPGFPESNREFQDYQSFRTHNFDVLLHLSGAEARILPAFLAEWSVMHTWNPELRYRAIGSATRSQAIDMIEASRKIVRAL